jgi:GDP/UDP-N,N'-diacetylbacillosamine 2-epimerase (hydrolysing)
MAQTLLRAQRSESLDICVCVTGMHLSPLFGSTVIDIETTGLPICGRVAAALDSSTGKAMAKAIGQEIIGMTDVFHEIRPDLVMVLGDRGEMLAGAVAAIHLNIPVVHVHGGERSGTVDEPVRHAISKLAHYHFVTTEGARVRLIRMGERAENVFVTGAPGLDGLSDLARRQRVDLCRDVGFDPAKPVALVMFHAVLQEQAAAGRQMEQIMQAVLDNRLQAVCLMPNADAGGGLVRETLQRYDGHASVRLITHLARADFVSWMASVDVMVGNSSSGIIEAATFGLPVVNVGERQRDRERSGNVIDVAPEREEIRRAVEASVKRPRGSWRNVYGDGTAGVRIVHLLETLALSPALLLKSNAY